MAPSLTGHLMPVSLRGHEVARSPTVRFVGLCSGSPYGTARCPCRRPVAGIGTIAAMGLGKPRPIRRGGGSRWPLSDPRANGFVESLRLLRHVEAIVGCRKRR